MKFSLVIPVAPYRKAEILDSLKKLDYPKKDFEIIVESGKNPSENRNRGIERARGNLIIFLDDDASVEKDYLRKIDNFFKKYPGIDIVGGPQLTNKGEKFFARISGIVLTSNFGAFKVNKRYSSGEVNLNADETFLTSANLCTKKKIFEKIEGFDIHLFPAEDPEFISRAKKSGLKIAYDPEMTIYHKRRDNFSSFCKQFFKYGFVRPQKNKISGETGFIFIVPMIFSVYFLFLPTLSLLNHFFITPLIAYIFLAIVFALYDSIKNKSFIGIFILPFLYLFIHLTYGLGMIAGYFSKITF